MAQTSASGVFAAEGLEKKRSEVLIFADVVERIAVMATRRRKTARKARKARKGKPFTGKHVLGTLGGKVARRSTRSSFVYVKGSTVIEGKRPGGRKSPKRKSAKRRSKKSGARRRGRR